MKLVNTPGAMIKVFERFPGRSRFSHPLDKVLELPIVATGVKNIFDFVFYFVVDDNRRRRRNNLTRKGVCGDRFEK